MESGSGLGLPTIGPVPRRIAGQFPSVCKLAWRPRWVTAIILLDLSWTHNLC